MAQIVRHFGVLSYGTLPNFTTTINTDVEVGVISVGFVSTLRMAFDATGNNLRVNVFESVDGGVSYVTTAIEVDLNVNLGAPIVKTYTGARTHVRVMVRPAVAGQHGTLAVKYYGQGPST